MKILIFVTDAQLFLMLRFLLKRAGFDAVLMTEPDEVPAASENHQVVAMLVDGASVEPRLSEAFSRAHELFPSVAIIHLQRKMAGDRISFHPRDLCLESPLDPAVLLDFLQRQKTRFIEAEREGAGTILRVADLSMDLAAVKVQRAGREIQLTALEFRLLRRLLQTPSAVCDREALIQACWPQTAEVEPRTVDIHIGHIRRALMCTGPDLIRTVRGRGYALDLPS